MTTMTSSADDCDVIDCDDDALTIKTCRIDLPPVKSKHNETKEVGNAQKDQLRVSNKKGQGVLSHFQTSNKNVSQGFQNEADMTRNVILQKDRFELIEGIFSAHLTGTNLSFHLHLVL